MSTDQNRPLVQPPGYENIRPSTYGQYQPIPMQPHNGRWSNNGQQHGMQLPPQPPPPPPPPPPPQQQRQQQNLRDQIRAHNSSDYWFESASTISAINCELPPEEPPTPSAPPYNEMEKISGYDEILQPHVAYVAPPPSYQEAISNLATSTVENFLSGSSLTEMEARQLLIGLAKSKCCWSKRAAEDMLIKSLTQTTAVHYMVKTFLETRATDWASEPFRGQIIDGPQNGVPPPPWDIEVRTPEMFRDTVINVEVPHTASVRVCHRCHGCGSVLCSSCSGLGRHRCYSCNSTGATRGFHHDEPRRICYVCDGNGQRICERCHGRGRTTCTVCEAAGQVKYFVKLTVTFKTRAKDFILERTLLPNQLIREVSGLILFEDTQPLLNPIQSFPEPEVNEQSAGIIQEHRALSQTGRIWMQNHVIRGVPVFQCDCQWKDKQFQYFVYGENRKVYADEYPQRCCCGCQLL